MEKVLNDVLMKFIYVNINDIYLIDMFPSVYEPTIDIYLRDASHVSFTSNDPRGDDSNTKLKTEIGEMLVKDGFFWTQKSRYFNARTFNCLHFYRDNITVDDLRGVLKQSENDPNDEILYELIDFKHTPDPLINFSIDELKAIGKISGYSEVSEKIFIDKINNLKYLTDAERLEIILSLKG